MAIWISLMTVTLVVMAGLRLREAGRRIDAIILDTLGPIPAPKAVSEGVTAATTPSVDEFAPRAPRPGLRPSRTVVALPAPAGRHEAAPAARGRTTVVTAPAVPRQTDRRGLLAS